MTTENKETRRSIEEAEQLYSPEGIRKSEHDKLFSTEKELILDEFRKVDGYAKNLSAAYHAMRERYQNSVELAKDKTLKNELLILGHFVDHLNRLVDSLKIYYQQSENSDNIQDLQKFTLVLQKLNTALKNVCDTTLLYDVSNNLNRIYPVAYTANAILLPLIFISLFLLVNPLITPVVIPIIAVASALVLLIPIVHGISVLLKRKSADHSINLNTERLEDLKDISSRIEDEFIRPMISKAKEIPAEKTPEFSYTPYMSVLTDTKGSEEKTTHFLEESDINYIKAYFKKS